MADEYGLDDIENEDLTADGLIAKLRVVDESEHGVPPFIWRDAKRRLAREGKTFHLTSACAAPIDTEKPCHKQQTRQTVSI